MAGLGPGQRDAPGPPGPRRTTTSCGAAYFVGIDGAGLREPEIPIARYERRLASAPDDLDAYRLLAAAYLAGHEYEKARRVIEAGLTLDPDDAQLIENRGEVRAGSGDPEGALADWRRSRDLDPETLSSVYSSAFLLECEGRLEEAMDAWHTIIDWAEARGYVLDTVWPKQELERLHGLSIDS